MVSPGAGSSRPAVTAYDGRYSIILPQPETRPITQEQLVNEVKGIYAGLVMVEKKCVEIDQQQATTTTKLTNEQWEALTALHRTLLHEHHDFLSACQHPAASPALRRLATKYAMPARMCRHCTHSFLELLRHSLPDSLDHMLSFVYLAYSMMVLLSESLSCAEDTWIECLGDLARYRVAIEEADLREREVWTDVAKTWYMKASDKYPDVGSTRHCSTALVRHKIVQLFFYSNTLASVASFQSARENSMLFFNPSLDGGGSSGRRHPPTESLFIKCRSLLFTHGSTADCTTLAEEISAVIDNIRKVTEYGGSEEGDSTERTTILRTSDNWTSTLRRVLHTFAQLAPVCLALRLIPGALAHDGDTSQTSTGSGWIPALVLATIGGLAGKMTREKPLYALVVTLHMFFAIGLASDELDPGTKFIAAAVALSPLLAFAFDRIPKKWHENDCDEQSKDAYPIARSDILMMEEGDLAPPDDDEDDSFHWTGQPRDAAGPVDCLEYLLGKSSGNDQYEDRDSSPEPWNGTEGFQR